MKSCYHFSQLLALYRAILLASVFLQCLPNNQEKPPLPKPETTLSIPEDSFDFRANHYGKPASTNSLLRTAIQENNVKRIALYLTQRSLAVDGRQLGYTIKYTDIANPYKNYGQGNTALHLAIEKKNWEAAAALLEYAVDNRERKINIA
ncbi:MAG: hypothetical protein ACK4M7_10465, partial [Burkholderiales bacterium]